VGGEGRVRVSPSPVPQFQSLKTSTAVMYHRATLSRVVCCDAVSGCRKEGRSSLMPDLTQSIVQFYRSTAMLSVIHARHLKPHCQSLLDSSSNSQKIWRKTTGWAS